MFGRGFLTVLLLLLALVGARADDDVCPAGRKPVATEETKLHHDLTCNYNQFQRPVKDRKSAVNIKVRFAVKYMSFDSLEEILTVQSWVAFNWKDEFMPWNPSEYGDIKETQIESHELWTPPLSLFNADATMYPSSSFYTTCMVNSEGMVTCVPQVSHSAICKTSLRWWPYDTQNCTLYFGSWMHSGELLNFTFYKRHPVVLDDYRDGPGWKLIKVDNARLPGIYTCCPNNTYPMLQYTFILKREAAGLAAIVVVPSVVVTILTLISLLLDIKDDVRLMVVGFSLFGHFAILIEIGYNLPKHSSGSDTPAMLLFLRDSMLVTLAALFVTLFLMSLRQRTLPAPTWIVSVTRLLSRGPGKYVVFTEFDPSEDVEKKRLSAEADGTSGAVDGSRHQQSTDWIQFANIFNSSVFIISLLVYLVLICNYLPYDN